MSQTHNIVFLGGGNMATAIIAGLLKQHWNGDQIHVIEITPEGRDRLNTMGVQAHASWPEGLRAEAVILAVKPQQMQDALASLQASCNNSLIISIAAGLPIDKLSAWLGGHQRIIRCMPNTPAMVGQGMTGAFPSPACSDADKDLASRILTASGQLVWISDEAMLNPVTAISGSGPGYVFYFMEHLEQAALEMGFAQADARLLVAQTFAGAAALALNSPDSFATLREKVTSKGGTTAAGLHRLDEGEVGNSIRQGAHAACARGIELGKIL